uniref:Exocyst complex component n=1 Tax=Panagrellus redivivus TaxID=6233 RepID=A0A7E4VMA7_PANRE
MAPTLSTTSTKDTTGGSSDTASTSYNAYAEMNAEQEFFLYELETTDSGSIGLVLRAIYDTGDVHKFSRALEQRIAHYDKNILKVCTYHYQGFIESMTQLNHLKDKCADVKEIAASIDDRIQSRSAELVKKGTEILRYRKLQRNANTAIEQITMCLPVLENYAKLQELMKQKKHYQALKVLEELEHTYAMQINKYRFTQSLAKSMEPIRSEIKKSSYDELRCFLEDVATIWKRIGADATKATAVQSGFYQTGEKKDSDMDSRHFAIKEAIQISKDGSILKTSSNTPTGSVKKGTLDHSVSVAITDKIDFAPIHRCCQIFNVLGCKEEFENYYRAEREKQARAVITPPTKFQEGVEGSVDYLNKIVGFFVVEDHIRNSQPGLVTDIYKDNLWELALQQIKETMNTHFGNCLDVEMMIRMKKVILLFALTMKSYGYSIFGLYKLLQNFRDQYNEILMSEYCAQFEKALYDDNYTPITVRNEEEFKSILVEFPHYKRLLDKEEYPKKFPFSRFVPKVFNQAKSYLRGCLRFMENLQLSQSDMDDTVRRYANVLLARWSGSLKAFVADRNRSLIQLVQITINMGYLERSCEFLERYITELTKRGEGSHLVTLKHQVFHDARPEVEQLIEAKLHEKVMDFLELANYDWELPAAAGVASDYIADLIKFLNTTFSSFTQLPSVLAKHVCMQTCKYLAEEMHSLLLSPDNKAVSPGALDQFSLDVMQCEMFTAQCPVDGFDDAILSMTFAHVRQLLDLVMNADWTTYLAERGHHNSKYARVKASDAAILLEKMIEFEKKNQSFFSRGGDRKKLYDTILRQLRTLA